MGAEASSPSDIILPYEDALARVDAHVARKLEQGFERLCAMDKAPDAAMLSQQVCSFQYRSDSLQVYPSHPVAAS
jgi:hypothetical protein